MHSTVPESSNRDETTTDQSTLDLVVQQYERRPPRSDNVRPAPATATPTTVVGRLIGFDAAGQPLVTLPCIDSNVPQPARATLRLNPAQINSDVVVIFAGDDHEQPIIIGCVMPPAPNTAEAAPSHVELNGQRLELTAQEEIVLRCGKSSITLTQAGKVIIRGEYLLSRSSGVNRIKGGSVQIN